MSANLDLVRSIYAAWERGDFSSAEWVHPEIEFVIADGPSPGRWAGVAGSGAGFRDFLSTWEDLCVEVDEYLLRIRMRWRSHAALLYERPGLDGCRLSQTIMRSHGII
jgi:hypothetical protein